MRHIGAAGREQPGGWYPQNPLLSPDPRTSEGPSRGKGPLQMESAQRRSRWGGEALVQRGQCPTERGDSGTDSQARGSTVRMQVGTG